jgi:predicted ABC-type ATPase
LIAAGLSPFAPERMAIKAGRLMLREIGSSVAARQSFAFETTLSSQNYARQIPVWRASGYHVSLYFLSLPSAENAIARVAERVRQGGHDIPVEVICRRFASGLKNFQEKYRQLVDAWALYDNSAESPVLMDWGEAR